MPDSHARSFNCTDLLYSKIQVASASVGLSSSELIRASCQAAIEEMADRDPGLRRHLDCIDHRARMAADEVAA